MDVDGLDAIEVEWPTQHIFVGTDNVYVAQVGPIYANLCVSHTP